MLVLYWADLPDVTLLGDNPLTNCEALNSGADSCNNTDSLVS